MSSVFWLTLIVLALVSTHWPECALVHLSASGLPGKCLFVFPTKILKSKDLQSGHILFSVQTFSGRSRHVLFWCFFIGMTKRAQANIIGPLLRPASFVRSVLVKAAIVRRLWLSGVHMVLFCLQERDRASVPGHEGWADQILQHRRKPHRSVSILNFSVNRVPFCTQTSPQFADSLRVGDIEAEACWRWPTLSVAAGMALSRTLFIVRIWPPFLPQRVSGRSSMKTWTRSRRCTTNELWRVGKASSLSQCLSMLVSLAQTFLAVSNCFWARLLFVIMVVPHVLGELSEWNSTVITASSPVSIIEDGKKPFNSQVMQHPTSQWREIGHIKVAFFGLRIQCPSSLRSWFSHDWNLRWNCFQPSW